MRKERLRSRERIARQKRRGLCAWPGCLSGPSDGRNVCAKHYRYFKARGDTKRRLFHEFVFAQKRGKPCADCGGIFPPEALDFDHVRGEKKIIISDMWQFAERVILAEIAKCDIRCKNCHAIKTYRNKEYMPRKVRVPKVLTVPAPTFPAAAGLVDVLEKQFLLPLANA